MSMSAIMTSDSVDGGRSYPSLGLGNTFAFKFEDLRGRVHRFNFGEFYSVLTPDNTSFDHFTYFFFLQNY